MKNFASQTLEKNEQLRETLNTELFRQLKETLPRLKINQKTYYIVEADRRIDEDQLLFYASDLQRQYANYQAVKDLPIQVRPDVTPGGIVDGIVAEVEDGKVFRWTPNSTVTYCVMRESFGNSPSAEGRYNQIVQEFKEACEAWTSIPNTSVPKYEHKQELDNTPLTQIPDVTFRVSLANLPPDVIASAFFPNDPKSEQFVLIDPGEYFSGSLSFDRVGVLRHELGHTLGFRHEHPRSEAPLVCQTPEMFEGDEIPLGAYDPLSVMHYFCNGFNNPDQQTLNEQRRKLEITELDKAGVRLVYPSEGVDPIFNVQNVDP